MQSRILTRFTTIFVFVFTCILSVNVVANERHLAPLLSPEAWKLLTDAEATSLGFTPTIVTSSQLEPRKPMIRQELVKLPNSRVMVKFADDLEMRLDVHSKPYSRTQRTGDTVKNLCDSLGVTLIPTTTHSQAEYDAIIHKAELISRKQQPDIAGMYWVNGDETSVDVAAELFNSMEEVEWVFYKPVFSKMPKRESTPDFRPPPSKRNLPTQKPEILAETQFGACVLDKGDCLEEISRAECIRMGGAYLGQDSICFQEAILPTNAIGGETQEAFGPNGECCVLLPIPTCLVVLNEVACLALNGVFLGHDTNAPPTPCSAATQTDCPALTGPPYAAYDLCGDPTIAVSYFTGDCYIDQVNAFQTNRTLAPGIGPFPSGCLDTSGATGALFGGLATDFPASGGFGAAVPITVFAGSICCETIQTNVPLCAAGNPWSALCSSYAQAYALNGTGICGRGPTSPTPPNSCFNPLGTILDAASVQPSINMLLAGNASQGILIANNGNLGANATAGFSITEAVVGAGCGVVNNCTLNLLENGGVSVAIPFGGVNTLTFLAGLITANGLGWTGTPIGGGTLLDTALHPINLTPTFNIAFAVPNIPQSITAVPIITGPGCLGAFGAPTFPRAAATPDYAALGILSWMTPVETPWAGLTPLPPAVPVPPQLLPLPSSTTTLTATQVAQMNQLMAWPMGGTALQSSALIPPLSPISRTIGWYGGDGGIDLFPDAPAIGGFGGAEVYKGSYGFGQLWADDGTGTNGAFGNGVTVAVLDWSAHLQQRTIVDEFGTAVNLGGIHEEFRANGLATNTVDANGNTVATASTVILEGTATGHTPLTLFFDENLPFRYSADHGTAVLGVIGANWSPASPLPGAAGYPPTLTTRLTGNVGVLGLAPDATLMFFPLATVTAPDREQTAWLNAIESLNVGDVICAAYEPVSVTATEPNLNYWPDTAAFIQLANNLAICTVIRAGHNGIDLTTLELPNGDQNAIVATAITPGTSHLFTPTNVPAIPGPPNAPLSPTGYKRYCDGTNASNFSFGVVQDYSLATASGWGMGVVACGKGPLRDNYLGYNTVAYAGASTYPSPASDPNIVHAQAYTNDFGLTDAAAAQAAGCVAQMQGFAKQIFTLPLGPQICRQLLASGKYEGVNRDGTPILTFADKITIETNRDSECEEPVPNNFDWDWCPNPTEGNLVGNLLDPRTAMINTILNPIFDTPNILSTAFIRGNQIMGNRFSLAAIDGNLIAATPVKTQAHIPYSVPPTVPGGVVRYRGNGKTTDLFITGELQSDLPMNNAIAIGVTLFPIQQTSMFLQLDMFDQHTGRWRQAAATTVLAQGDTTVGIQVENASAFINPGDNRFSLRLITLDINNPNGGPTAVYPVYYDQVTVTAGYIQQGP
jgi:hypothetical protein